MEGARAAAAADGDGPNVLGLPSEAVGELAAFDARSAAGDRGRLALAGIQTVLDLEESMPKGSADDQESCETSLRG